MLFTYNLSIYWIFYLINTTPIIWVFGLSTYHWKAFKNINDIVNAPSFHAEFLSALIKQQLSFWLLAIYPQKFPAKLAQAHIFSAVFYIALTCVFVSLTFATFSVAFVVTIFIFILRHTHDVIDTALLIHGHDLSKLRIVWTVLFIILLSLLWHINVLLIGLPDARNRYSVFLNMMISLYGLIKRRLFLILVLPTVWKYTWLGIPYLGLWLHWFHPAHLKRQFEFILHVLDNHIIARTLIIMFGFVNDIIRPFWIINVYCIYGFWYQRIFIHSK